MLHLYLLERQATDHARDVQKDLLQRQRLEQARDRSRDLKHTVRLALRGWSLPGLAAVWTDQPGALRM